LISLLASCGGGSGSGGGSGGVLQDNPNASFLASVAEPSSPAVASDWSGTQEYANSTGLAQLKAAEGYARRSGGLPGGQGVRIAIIDSGIDVTHPELGNISSQSWAAGGEPIEADSHATFVAGIAGARRTQSANSNDMHGIAYNATLVNFQASRPSVVEARGEVTFSTGDLVDAIRAASGLDSSAAAVESDILNLSLGGYSSSDSTFANLRTAMRAAASQGKIMVLAAGNEGLNADPTRKLQPIYPAAYADDVGVAGSAIVVGNLTSTDQAAPSSNLCGDVMAYCLFAPGSSIRSTLPGGLYGIGSGTSFAVPYVSGAAAVVQAAFPGVSSQDVVDRLLLTAEDLGAPGVDSTFGRGKLDLEAAMAPVGPTGFPIGPTVGGRRLAVDSTALRLGPGLQISGAAKARLKHAMAVDEMGFPFAIDLASAIETTPRNDGLARFISYDPGSMASAGLKGANIAAFVPEDDVLTLSAEPVEMRGSTPRRRSVPLKFEADVTTNIGLFASIYGESAPKLGLETELLASDVLFLSEESFFSPYDQWTKETAGAGFSLRPSDKAEVAFSAQTSLGDDDGSTRSMQRVEAKALGPGSITFHLGVGLVQEEGGFLGGTSKGALGSDLSAHSQFLTVSAKGPLSESIDWFGSYSRGRSSIDGGSNSLLSDWSEAEAEAFGMGLVMRDLASQGDGLTLMVGQPLRQEKLRAALSLPVARQPNGDVIRMSEKVDVAPTAREIATEIGYRLPLGEQGHHDLRAAGFLRFKPDHDQSQAPETGVGLVYRWRF
jgi:subtilisin family serine protease